MKQQTAVDFLEDCFDKYEKWISGHYKAEAYSFTDLSNDIQKAKELEKEHIEKSFNEGWLQCNIDGLHEKSRKHFKTADEYFDFTYTQSSE